MHRSRKLLLIPAWTISYAEFAHERDEHKCGRRNESLRDQLVLNDPPKTKETILKYHAFFYVFAV